MHDPWIEKISASIDGALSATEELALQEHLAGCPECSSVAAELRNVVAAAHEAPALEPARDLWPQIAARLGRQAAGQPSIARIERLAPVASLQAHGKARQARRFSFSAPQLAAAAVILMSVSGAAVWLISDTPPASTIATGTIVQSAGGAPGSVQTVSRTAATADYEDDVAGLERALEENRAQLDPATVEVIERSLDSIDQAIEDARSALAADPNNPYLHRQLDNTMRKKIDVLRRATGAQRAQS